MKKRNFIIATVLAALSILTTGCEDPFAGWPEFPHERFKAYAPYKEGDEVMFCNAAEDTAVYRVKSFRYKYEQITDRRIDNYGCETSHISVKLESEDGISIRFYMSSGLYRTNLFAEVNLSDGKIGIDSECDLQCETMAEFPALLTDTLRLERSGYSDGNYSLVVNGRGVTEFSFGGEVWRLVE